MNPSPGETDNPQPAHPHAFIFYRPTSQASGELVYFNEAARTILSYASLFPDRGSSVVPDLDASHLSALCVKWVASLEACLKQDTAKPGDSGGGYIEIIQSYRRRYAVRGIRLHQFPSKKPGSSASKKEKNYLFILERITLEEPGVSILFRQKKLSRREQQIVQYLLRGYGNKEIAAHLGLSENTIKGYLKLLMRKLGVGSRSGILALLLAKKPE